ncbi:MAG: GNAT family N-acetyltransferase [Candidatus Thorarchaeota archaeon]
MRFEIMKLKEADIRKLSEISYESKQRTSFRDDSRTLNSIETRLIQASQNDNELTILAYDDSDNHIGWMTVFLGFPEIIITRKWHPVVRPGDDEFEVAKALLNEYKRYGVEIGRIRLEGTLDRITESHQEILEKYSRLYESQGFYKVTEEGSMELVVDEKEISQAEIPDGFDLVHVSEKTNEEIKESFFDTFLDSKDGLFLDSSHKQQVNAFNHWFNRERELIEDASLLILKDNEVAGFIVTRPHHNDAEIAPVGVNPKFRRQGFGKVLLSRAIYASHEKGINRMILELDTSNVPAFELYKSFGFKLLHKAAFYAWLPEGRKQ